MVTDCCFEKPYYLQVNYFELSEKMTEVQIQGLWFWVQNNREL